MILTIIISVVLSLFILFLGYAFAIYLWQPKETKIELEKYKAISTELTTMIQKHNDNIQQYNQWYLQQIEQLNKYLIEKHDDYYIQEKLVSEQMIDMGLKTIKKNKFNLDDILDKASKYGLDSLSVEEINFLKNHKN